jgi:L-alanine-DL-glutamate epimerase-like enolase superfamily enzyme
MASRRNFLKSAAVGSLGFPLAFNGRKLTERNNEPNYDELDEVLKKPVLNKSLFSESVVIEDIELLRYRDNFICRVRSARGATGISVSNNFQMKNLYPIFINRIQPFFIGKDALELEKLLEEVYVYKSNYKLQSLALWVPLATLEFAILDLLGNISGKPIGELIGKIYNEHIAVYRANNFRGRSAEESVELIKKQVEESSAKALKFKVGGRMSREETPSGRSERLIPLVRKTFGEDMTIYADSNGSYDIKEAIRIGKLMEEYEYDFFEEPVPFDWYEETRVVTDNLAVPIAGGEQEPSMHNFRWLIANNALDVIQQDIFYFGGMIRSMRVAQMAEQKNLTCTPHISGSGLGYLYMMHFVSAIPNAGPYHEFKGLNKDIPMECPTSSLTVRDGRVKVPTGPGLGVEIDPEYINKHKKIKI